VATAAKVAQGDRAETAAAEPVAVVAMAVQPTRCAPASVESADPQNQICLAPPDVAITQHKADLGPPCAFWYLLPVRQPRLGIYFSDELFAFSDLTIVKGLWVCGAFDLQ
jgi:hypothetical protein